MNGIEKIGMYSTDEILEFMTDGEGRGFMGRSMYDAMYFKIKELQSKIDKAIEFIDNYEIIENIDHDIYMTLLEIKDILKEDK